MLLSSKNIRSYLTSDEKQFKIFDLLTTKKEKDCIDKFDLHTDNVRDFLHFSTDTNLDNLEKFMDEIGSNSNDNVIIISNFIKNIINIVMKGYQKKDYCLIIKAVPPTNLFDIPRWHCDGIQRGFDNRDDISKFATVLKGPATLFIKTTPEEREQFIEIEKGRDNTMDYRKK
jgi:hypothetical protein